jgi:O-antigen/teichoic acid export membrane protein
MAVLLPPVLVRHLAPGTYAVWVLILQVVAYIGYLDVGLQTAVGRYIAFAEAKKDAKLRDGIFSTAFAGLVIAGSIGLVLILIAAALAQRVFPSIPEPLLAPMRIAISIVGISVALGLPASACNGVFSGLQRYEIPAITTSAGKLLSALGLIWAALSGRSLVAMACVLAAANLLSYALQVGMLRRVVPEIGFRRALITKSTVRELSGYCISLTIWSFSSLLISGLDILLVGHFRLSAVVPYSVSSTLIAFLSGILYAIFGVIMPHAAGLEAHEDACALGDLVVSSTKLGVLLLLLMGLPLIVLAAPLIRIWIGAQFVTTGSAVLMILVIANMLRMTGAPYASVLIGAGQQRAIIVGPLTEGMANLICSVLLGSKFGALGVAWGTLIGAAFGVSIGIFYNLPRTRDRIDVSRLRYVGEGLVTPALCGIPVYAALLATALGQTIGSTLALPALIISLFACFILLLRSALMDGRSGQVAQAGA